MNKPLSIHLLYEYSADREPHGCSQIRLLRPFLHPSLKDRVIVGYDFELPDKSVDIVIIERLWKPEINLSMAEELIQKIRLLGSKLIYTLDDNLLDLHLDQPWWDFPRNEHRQIIRYFAREADGIIVSTERLKQRLQNLNSNIRVVPNALDEQLFPYREKGLSPIKENHQPLRFGYMGTPTHTADFMMVLEPLRQFLRENAEHVRFEIVGVSSHPHFRSCFKGLPVHILDPGREVAYHKFIRWIATHLKWDFAISPLEDNSFTRCKSDIKFLDYAMLGIPGIFSAVDAYQKTINHLETGWLCENSSANWLNAMRAFYRDDALRNRIRGQAFNHVLGSRTLQHRADDWLDTVFTLVS